MNTKKRILIVDDEADFTAVTAMALEGIGRYKVRQENSATHALEAALEFRPELILLDIMMPDKDGGDVLADLQSRPETRDVPVVFLTALVAANESPFGSISSGGRQYLPKPVSLGSLAMTIDDALKHPKRPAAIAPAHDGI
jgi:CheY-like chemotaxis protein